MTVATLQTLTNEENFKFFLAKSNSSASILDIEDPKLPRKRRVPASFEGLLKELLSVIVSHTFVQFTVNPWI